MTLSEADVLANIAARRTDISDLLGELQLRCDEMGPAVLNSPERQDLIAEVVAPFRLDPFELFLIGDQCTVTVDPAVGRTISFAGFLADIPLSQTVGMIKREIFLDQKFAYHHFLEIQSQYRTKAMALILLDRGFDFYRAMDFDSVLISTGLTSGRWYWARCGFDFDPSRPEVRVRLERWYRRVLEAFDYVPPDEPRCAQDWALLGTEDPGFTVSFAELDARIEGYSQRLREVSEENRIDWDERIEIGRAAMLSGHDWPGVFDLRDEGLQAAFEAHFVERVQELARRLEN